MFFARQSMRIPQMQKKRPDFRPAPAVTRFKRLHRGAQKGGATNLGSLSEPRHEQNLYANPKRTAKSFIRYNCIDAVSMQMVQKFVKLFCAFKSVKNR
jgi:hypothetical protein